MFVRKLRLIVISNHAHNPDEKSEPTDEGGALGGNLGSSPAM